MNILEAKDVCLWYGNTQALKHISMEIHPRSITSLIGPSGCGKSTFLKTLNRMNDLVPGVKITGEVRYQGENIYDSATNVNELRRQAARISDRTAFFLLGELIEYGDTKTLFSHPADPRTAAYVAGRFG